MRKLYEAAPALIERSVEQSRLAATRCANQAWTMLKRVRSSSSSAFSQRERELKVTLDSPKSEFVSDLRECECSDIERADAAFKRFVENWDGTRFRREVDDLIAMAVEEHDPPAMTVEHAMRSGIVQALTKPGLLSADRPRSHPTSRFGGPPIHR